MDIIKYANFFISNTNKIWKNTFTLQEIILPLAISFFTFQQIAYLVDTYKGETREYNFLHYCLFVTFFPQLIAGPIVHHKEVLPQFAKNRIYKFNYENIAIGLTIFFIGLFKKVVLADSIALYATPIFNASNEGIALTLFEAWGGVLAYSFQIYFDFSGYSDMSIGLARLFGIKMPRNFHSPYKAVNIIEFWKRWHITLSRFLKDYLYIPLGGNRKGNPRRYANLLTTMILGGLWHGAGWTFVAWGFLHGMYLVINHLWFFLKKRYLPNSNKVSLWNKLLAQGVTFFAVNIAWVFFRSDNFHSSIQMLKAMFGFNGISLPVFLSKYIGTGNSYLLQQGYLNANGMFQNGVFQSYKFGIIFLIVLFLLVLKAPNTQEIMAHYKPSFELYKYKTLDEKLQYYWKFNHYTGIVISLIIVVSILFMGQVSEFLYFQF